MNERLKKTKIVCIGGGTGTFVVLRGLKEFPCHLSAIVTMSDSGGSNKRLRDEFGLLPTSDIRQCFVALSEENGGIGLLRKLFMYRFEKGRGISGMTFGNLFMAALTDILGSQEEAIRQTGKVLRIHGNVIPVTLTRTNLYARYEDGRLLTEEHLIDEPRHDGKLKISQVFLKPKAQANPEALKAIQDAEVIILGPGDLYTSLIPNLLVIGDALKKAKGKIIFVLNLMTKYGQTFNFTAQDHLNVLKSLINNAIDYVIVNNEPISKQALSFYHQNQETVVVDNLGNQRGIRIIRADVISRALFRKTKSDVLVRSLIRHDSRRLAQAIFKIIEEVK